jgi:OOP family OmpA-OmpF porin
MTKKILAAVVLAGLCVASVAGATPMTEFNKGEGQIDIAGWQHGGTFDKIASEKRDGDSKIGFVGTATYAIANKWGLQYGYHDLTTGDLDRMGDKHVGGYQNELNVLYSFDPHAAVYLGWNQIHANLKDDSTKNNIGQLGIVAKTPLANKLDLFGNFAVGTKSTLMGEAGLGYNIAKNLDLNGGYRYLKTSMNDEDYSWKGFFLGLSGRFGGAAKPEEGMAYREVEKPAAVTPAPAVVAPATVANDYYFNSIHFDFDKDNIRNDQVANADSIVSAAKQTGHVFKLVGNTDGIGDNSYNDDLSKRRVDNVAAYVKAHGVPASQIVTQYKGKNSPAETNDTEAGRAANRRVDVYEHK